MSWKDILLIIIVLGLILSLISTIGISSFINGYKTDLDKTKEDLRDYEDMVSQYKGLMKNSEETIDYLQNRIDTYKCPECEDCDKNPIYDVNRDGIVNFEDSTLILNYINYEFGYIESNFYKKYGNAWEFLYDVNFDGLVNKDDAQFVSNNMD